MSRWILSAPSVKIRPRLALSVFSERPEARYVGSRFFPFVFSTKKGKSRSQAFLAETMETVDKNLCVTETMHILRRKLR